MKVVTLLRTLNEEKIIARHCQNQQWCDAILLADGGSTDDTLKIARRFDNVKIRHFGERLPLPDGTFMNPEPDHLNFLLDWADEVKADWVIIADADTWPNLLLQREGRGFMAAADKVGQEGILAYQIYLWGEDEYFPKINEAGQAQWAWRANLGLRYPTTGKNNFEVVAPGPNRANSLVLDKPHVIMHYFSNTEREELKIKRYAAWGHPKTHILKSIYAPPEPLPGWIKEWQA